MPQKEVIDFVKDYAGAPGVIGGLGGLAHYVYQVSRGERFRLFMFISNIFLAGWLAHTIASFLPDTTMRDSLIGITGFCSYPLLAILEKKGGEYLTKYIFK